MVSGKNVSQRYAYNFNTGFQTSATDAQGQHDELHLRRPRQGDQGNLPTSTAW